MDYDVVVVGAGFAGLACARELAGSGVKVLVLEKKRQAGQHIHTTGILVKEAQDEWAAPERLVREIRRVRVYGPSLRSAAVERDDYFFLATDTAGLLGWLQDETADSGVEIRVGEAFSGARRERGHWVLDESGTTCRFLVGADGARSPVAKLMGLDRNTRYLKGVEYAYEPLEEAELSLHCFVDPEFAPGYIGWVLPGVGVTQVGLACHSSHSVDLRSFIRRIDSLFGLSKRRVLEKRGGIIPIGGLLRNFYAEGVMLLGDAAGMVSPLTAGGIHRAYRYGRLAGAAIACHLSEDGPDPGEAIQRLYPRRRWQHAARWAFDHLSSGAVIEAVLRTPRIFRRIAGKIFFDRMNWPE
ncbi:MAG: NAD(P)/FAD-dependent oxidoreductase [Gammaproteobacteria bacterium]|nr:NAD(P)/FAD-dependent oxidoreductase [Gammaproteobacteria bacterium]